MNIRAHLLVVFFFATSAATAAPVPVEGVFGGGNTGDLSSQLAFAQSTAIAYVRAITPAQLEEHTESPEVRRIYRACRATLLEGLLTIDFEVVEALPEGRGFHALMQRRAPSIRVSRREFERGISIGLITAPSLIAHLIHEVGHDCALEGRRLQDSDDALLDKLGVAVASAGMSQHLSPFIDYQVLRDVHQGRAVVFESFSARLREELSKHILNFVGERIYSVHHRVIGETLGQRPAPATQLHRSYPESRVPTWREAASVLPSLDGAFVREFVLRSLETRTLSVGTEAQSRPVRRELDCAPASVHAERAVRCRLIVQLDELDAAKRLGLSRIFMRFTLDIFGEVFVESITTLAEAPPPRPR